MRTLLVRGATPSIVQDDGTVPAASGSGFTLVATETYFIEVGDDDSSQLGVHLLAASALVITSIHVETSNFADASLRSAVDGEWIPEDPEGAVVTVEGNITAEGLVLAKTAGAYGAAMLHLSNIGARRARLAIVVGAAGGVLRFATWARE
jgi:hypothetical protein